MHWTVKCHFILCFCAVCCTVLWTLFEKSTSYEDGLYLIEQIAVQNIKHTFSIDFWGNCSSRPHGILNFKEKRPLKKMLECQWLGSLQVRGFGSEIRSWLTACLLFWKCTTPAVLLLFFWIVAIVLHFCFI